MVHRLVPSKMSIQKWRPHLRWRRRVAVVEAMAVEGVAVVEGWVVVEVDAKAVGLLAHVSTCSAQRDPRGPRKRDGQLSR